MRPNTAKASITRPIPFIQSYAADKRLTVADLRYEKIDVVTGAVMTGVIGFFVVVTCADTL